jgi:leucyl-tRNA synthetase
MLPVTLPDVTDFQPVPQDDASDPVPALARAAGWAHVTLDLGDGPKRYRRELNVMPQWAGSSWYYLRYLDPFDETALVDPDIERYWMRPGGVDLYVGGVEHAVLHLIYARFWHQVLYDIGVASTPEPFGRLFNQGYILADAFTDARGQYQTIIAVREDFAALRFNTAIARIIELTGHASRLDRVPRALAEPLVLIVAPLAPHIAEELWQRLGHSESLAYEPFPQADPALAADATVTLPVQVNGKRRFSIEVPTTAGKAEIADVLACHPEFPGNDAARLIIVPGRIVNIVLRLGRQEKFRRRPAGSDG